MVEFNQPFRAPGPAGLPPTAAGHRTPGLAVLVLTALGLAPGLFAEPVSPAPDYVSPYTVSGLNTDYVQDIGSLTTPGSRLDTAVTTTTPAQASWYDQSQYAPNSPAPLAQGVSWGPKPLLLPRPVFPAGIVNDPAKVTVYFQQRLVAAAFQLVGRSYQHHHDPVWDPASADPAWPWQAVANQTSLEVWEAVLQPDHTTYKPEVVKILDNPYVADYAKNLPGLDCSDLSALALNVAAGVYLDSAVGDQGNVTPAGAYGGQPPLGWNLASEPTFIDPTHSANVDIDPLAPLVFLGPNAIFHNGQGTATFNAPGTLDAIIAQLQPGDLLYIVDKPGPTAKISHVIMWLGQYGTNADGSPSADPLIINSHANSPAILDGDGNLPPPGVEIVPFQSVGWFYTNFSHAMRVVTPAPCDVNWDTKVDDQDLAIVANLLAGSASVLPREAEAGVDPNRDGKLDSLDLIAVLRARH